MKRQKWMEEPKTSMEKIDLTLAEANKAIKHKTEDVTDQC